MVRAGGHNDCVHGQSKQRITRITDQPCGRAMRARPQPCACGRTQRSRARTLTAMDCGWEEIYRILYSGSREPKACIRGCARATTTIACKNIYWAPIRIACTGAHSERRWEMVWEGQAAESSARPCTRLNTTIVCTGTHGDGRWEKNTIKSDGWEQQTRLNHGCARANTTVVRRSRDWVFSKSSKSSKSIAAPAMIS